MKAQVSTEVLVIIGLILLVFIPLLIVVYLKVGEANDQIAEYQAELAVFRIAYLANSVGSLGTNSSVTTDIYIPKGTEYFRAKKVGNGGVIALKISTPTGPSEIVEIVRYPVEDFDIIKDKVTESTRIRLTISSEYEENNAKISIAKE